MLFRSTGHVLFVGLGAILTTACGGSSRTASPQTPHAGKVGTAALTGAGLSSRVARVLVADDDAMAMVSRGGCVATIGTGADKGESYDEMRVRCPKPARSAAWFASLDRLLESVPMVRVAKDDDDDDDVPLPAAELATASGTVYRLERPSDAARLVADVRALSAELAAEEMPHPGPASPSGWQMLRVAGQAHVFFGGERTTGTLEARMSTTGQYLCEFRATTEDGPMRATKSGWVEPKAATTAIEDVLSPFEATAQGRAPETIAVAIGSGGEQRANPASTAAVFEKFSPVQKLLGDACLPELEAPKTENTL